jgi:hypothetical protein
VKKRQEVEHRCVINLLSITTVYLILILPYVSIWSTYFYSDGIDFKNTDQYGKMVLVELTSFAYMFNMINYTVNFIIYVRNLDYFR